MAWYDGLFGGGSTGGGTGDGMDWWGALFSGISSYSQGRETRDMNEDQIRQQGEQSRQNIGEQGRQQRLNTQYESGLADYYKQLNQQRRRQGFSNFGQFANTQYNQTNTPPPVGAVPNALAFEEEQRRLMTGG